MIEDAPNSGPTSDRVLTPTTWLNAAHVEQWLRSLWPSWRYDEIRDQWDSQGRWVWIVPDYIRGRSRILGIEGDLLEEVTVTRLRHILEEADWLRRIESEALLITRDEHGHFRVETWQPDVDEAWFSDPRAGNYLAYRRSSSIPTSWSPRCSSAVSPGESCRRGMPAKSRWCCRHRSSRSTEKSVPI